MTFTDVALPQDQLTVVVPGAAQLPGVALIDAVTGAGAVTVKLAVSLAGPPYPYAVMLKV